MCSFLSVQWEILVLAFLPPRIKDVLGVLSPSQRTKFCHLSNFVYHFGFRNHGNQCLNLCKNLWAKALWNEKVSRSMASSEGGEDWAVRIPGFSLAYVNICLFCNSHLVDTSWTEIGQRHVMRGQSSEGSLCPPHEDGLAGRGVWGVAVRAQLEVEAGEQTLASLLTIQVSRLCSSTRFHFKWLILVFSSTKQKKLCGETPHPLLFALLSICRSPAHVSGMCLLPVNGS